jgi:hypothetical protein
MQDKYSILTSASPERVWNIWSDVENWHRWEPALRQVKQNGVFGLQTKGMLKSEYWPNTPFNISSCEKNFSYTVHTRLPFAQMYIKRLIGYNNNKTLIMNEVWIEGPLSGLWWRLIGKKYKEMLPQIMEKFKRLAEG